MKRLWLAMLLTLAATPAAAWSGKVVGVTDGDDLKVLRVVDDMKKEVKIRLYGIDAPEKKQAFGTQAKKANSDLAFGKVVEVSEVDTDRYGRTVADVTLPDKTSLNMRLVYSGMAWWYRKYAPKDKTLEKLEAEARKAKRGLWQDPDPTPPWKWRADQKKKPKASQHPETCRATEKERNAPANKSVSCVKTLKNG